MPLSAVLLIFCCLLGSWQRTYGQTTNNTPYSDPDEVRLASPLALVEAGHEAFSTSERLALCQRGRGFIKLACQVDSKGRIQAITSATLHQAAQSLSPALLNRWKKSVRQHVVFHVPAVDKSPTMSRYRRPSIIMPLRAFCQ
jgi:hypothetical protein